MAYYGVSGINPTYDVNTKTSNTSIGFTMLTLSSLSLGAALASARGAFRAARSRDWAAFAVLAVITVLGAAGSIPVISMIVASGWSLRAVDLVLMLTFAGFSVYTLTVLGDMYAVEMRADKARSHGSARVITSSAH